MNIVLNIRGTNGSGKSTLVRSLMEHLESNKFVRRPLAIDYKEAGYRFDKQGTKLYVLGKYTTACGGLDSSFSYKGAADDVIFFLDELAQKGNVVCEGVVAMSSYGFGRLSKFAIDQKEKGQQVVFGLMDTPLEVCIQRCEERRAAKAAAKGSVAKPLNPQNLVDKWNGTHKDQQKLKDAGFDCRLIPYQDSLSTVLSWLNIADLS